MSLPELFDEEPPSPAQSEPPEIVAVVIKGAEGQDLVVPTDELRRVDQMFDNTCADCGAGFEPRQHPGGKKQLYCSSKCRMAAFGKANRGAKPLKDNESDEATLPAANSDTPLASLMQELKAGGAPNDLIVRCIRAVEPALYPQPAPPAEMPRDDWQDFDWASDPSIVTQGMPATAVYLNKVGHVVLRQEAGQLEDADSFVIIAPSELRRIIDKLCDVAGIGGAP